MKIGGRPVRGQGKEKIQEREGTGDCIDQMMSCAHMNTPQWDPLFCIIMHQLKMPAVMLSTYREIYLWPVSLEFYPPPPTSSTRVWFLQNDRSQTFLSVFICSFVFIYLESFRVMTDSSTSGHVTGIQRRNEMKKRLKERQTFALEWPISWDRHRMGELVLCEKQWGQWQERISRTE